MRLPIICMLLVLCTMPCAVNAQQDYFFTNKALNIGSQLEDGGQAQNAKFCQVRAGDHQITKYTPYEVQEYGFKDGRVYLAKDILTRDTTRRVFLERLVKGKMVLYLYKGPDYKEFYLEKDSGELIPLTKSRKDGSVADFRTTLGRYSGDCAAVQDLLNLIIYSEKSLASFVDAYNKCEFRDFPYIKYGVMLGYVNTSLLIPSGVSYDFLKGSNIGSDGSFNLSLFIDYPLGKKGLSFHPEVQYVRNNFDYYRYNTNQYWMVINTSCINFPMMLRYTVPIASSEVRPYVNAGGQVSFLLKNESQVLEDVMEGDIIVSENIHSANLLSRFYAGYIAGAGLQFNIRHRINLFAEFRYSRGYALLEPTLLDKAEYFLLTGISF